MSVQEKTPERGDKVTSKPPVAPERRSSSNAGRESADSFLLGVNMVDALMFADAEHEANDLDSHSDLWRVPEYQPVSAHSAGGGVAHVHTESSANSEPAAAVTVTQAPAPGSGVPPVPVSLRPGTLIENAGRLNAIQQLIGRLHGGELRESLEMLRTHFLDQSSGTASSDLLDDYDMLRRALDSLPASGSGASEPPTPQKQQQQPAQAILPSDEPLPADADDSLFSAIFGMPPATGGEAARSGEGQQPITAASGQSTKGAEQTQPEGQSSMLDSTTEPPTSAAEDGFSLGETLALGKLPVCDLYLLVWKIKC